MISVRPLKWRALARCGIVAALAFLGCSQARAVVSVGGFAVVGFTDHDSILLPDTVTVGDTFSIAAMETISAGTVVYFTDSGWTTGGIYRGATLVNGAGLEGLIKLTISSTVAAGTVLRSGFNSAGVTWDYSSLVPGADGSSSADYYSLLPINQSGIGEQIYGFQSSATDFPMMSPSNHIFTFDMGDYLNPGFETAFDDATGLAAPGTSLGDNSAIAFTDTENVVNLDDFHYGSFALNMDDADVVALNTSGGTKAQWLAVIANPANWRRFNFENLGEGTGNDYNDGDAEDTLGPLNFAPEPSRAMLLLGGLSLAAAIRRRQRP
jgi:hypothetical protein